MQSIALKEDFMAKIRTQCEKTIICIQNTGYKPQKSKRKKSSKREVKKQKNRTKDVNRQFTENLKRWAICFTNEQKCFRILKQYVKIRRCNGQGIERD